MAVTTYEDKKVSERQEQPNQHVEVVGKQHDIARFHIRMAEGSLARGSGRKDLLSSQKGLLDSGHLAARCILGDRSYSVGAELIFGELSEESRELRYDAATDALAELRDEAGDRYYRISVEESGATQLVRAISSDAWIHITAAPEGISFEMIYGLDENKDYVESCAYSVRSPHVDSLILLRTMNEVLNEYCRHAGETNRVDTYFEIPPMSLGELVPAGISFKEPAAVAEQGAEAASRRSAFDKFGGLDREIAELKAVLAMWENPELCREYDLERPTGVLLHGPGGTGKTELARAVAHELDADITEVRMTDILTKWVGEPAQNLRELFNRLLGKDGLQVAFFDEFDGLFSRQASGNEGVARSLIAEFKTILSNMSTEYPGILVVAAANSIDQFDPALLRPGRIDTVLQIGLPGRDARESIFDKYLERNFALYDLADAEALDPDQFVSGNLLQGSGSVYSPELAALTESFSGADIEAVLKDARRAKMMAHIATGKRAGRITQNEIKYSIDKLRRSRSADNS